MFHLLILYETESDSPSPMKSLATLPMGKKGSLVLSNTNLIISMVDEDDDQPHKLLHNISILIFSNINTIFKTKRHILLFYVKRSIQLNL